MCSIVQCAVQLSVWFNSLARFHEIIVEYIPLNHFSKITAHCIQNSLCSKLNVQCNAFEKFSEMIARCSQCSVFDAQHIYMFNSVCFKKISIIIAQCSHSSMHSAFQGPIQSLRKFYFFLVMPGFNKGFLGCCAE